MRSGVKSSELVSCVLSFKSLLAYHGRKMHGFTVTVSAFNIALMQSSDFRHGKKDAERPAGQGALHSRWTGTDPFFAIAITLFPF